MHTSIIYFESVSLAVRFPAKSFAFSDKRRVGREVKIGPETDANPIQDGHTLMSVA